jgi:hypothetical protein
MTERYHLVLTPLAGWPNRHQPIPPDARLRQALKMLVRRFGLRCSDARAEPMAGRETDATHENGNA